MVVPVRRDMAFVPAEARWIVKGFFADATSASLRRRRGTLVVPVEVVWIIHVYAVDATSASLRAADLASRSLRGHNRRGTFIVPVLQTRHPHNAKQASQNAFERVSVHDAGTAMSHLRKSS